MRTIKGYGWTPALPDHRDFQFARTTPVVVGAISFKNRDWGVYDQKNTPMSSINAVLSVYRNLLGEKFSPSRNALYSEIIKEINPSLEDTPCSIRDVLKVLQRIGAASTSDWGDNQHRVISPKGFTKRKFKKLLNFEYFKVGRTEGEMCTALVQNKNLLVGFSVYDSFVTPKVAKNGKVPLPSIKENQVGGIAAEVIGYDLSEYTFTIKCNWGNKWGQHGYVTVPISYLTNPNLIGECWTLKV